MTDRRIVVLGPSSGPRLEAFQAALRKLGHRQAEYVGYHDFLARPDVLERALSPATWLRFESPDRDPKALEALYRAGATEARMAGYPVFAGTALSEGLTTRGWIGSPAQLYFGLRRTLRRAAQIGEIAGARLSAGPADLALAYDKTECSRHLGRCAIPVPAALDPVSSFDQLIARMREQKRPRVFVKLRHGSAAAGMVALALGPGGRMSAFTTAELGRDGAPFATRRLGRLDSAAAIGAIVDALAPRGLHVEAWVPKAGIDNLVCDLRLVVVQGAPVFPVLRMSRHPMTNLHLGGHRKSAELIRTRMPRKAWDGVIETAHAVARALPSCFMLGVDLAVLAGFGRHAVLEVNAFGDHVKGVRLGGHTPQELQILRFQAMRMAS